MTSNIIAPPRANSTFHEDSQASLFEPKIDLSPTPAPSAKLARLTAIHDTPEGRAQFVIDLIIFTDPVQQALDSIDALMHRSRTISAPGGAILLGNGGTGKTFISNRLLKRYPPQHGRLTSFVPAVMITLENAPKVEDVKLAILASLGQKNTTRKLTTAERSDDVINALRACNTCCLLIDEAHHLQLTSGRRQNKDRLAGLVGDYLKTLYDRTRIAFIFFGKPSLGDLFSEDEQLASRWPGRIKLEPYKLDEHWTALLSVLDEALPMANKACLDSNGYPSIIHSFTQGNFRRLKNFLSEAVRQAAMDSSTDIKRGHLQQAYYLLGYPNPNPFNNLPA